MKQEEAIKERIYGLIDRMSKRIGVNIPRKNYPAIRIEDVSRPNYESIYNDLTLNHELLNSGTFIGEEIGHFLRVKIKELGLKEPLSKLKYYLKHPFGNELDRVPSTYEKEDIHSNEFFGYLGRRLLHEIATEKDNLKFEKSTKSPNEVPRRSRLEHLRPYRFADQIDLTKISDYRTLFSLPDKEVRSRFFRNDPQYDLTKPIKEAKITKRNSQNLPKTYQSNLEIIVKLISPIFLVASIFLISKKTMTGNAIRLPGYQNTIPIVVILLISLVFLIAIEIKRKKRKR